MAVDLEKINEVLTNPTTVNLHKNPQVENDIKVNNRTDLASSDDMGQNFIYANSNSLEQDPRVGRYRTYVNITDRQQFGSMDSGVQKYTKSLSLKSLAISLGSTSSTSASDAYKVSSSNSFDVVLTPTPNVTNLVCNITLTASEPYSKYFTIEKVNNFNFTVTPDYEGLYNAYKNSMPFSVRFHAQDNNNSKIAYRSSGVYIDGYIVIESASSSGEGSSSSVQYIHIMYSKTADHSDMAPSLSGATWMGVLTDFNVEASVDPNDYTWSYIKGDPGSEGQAGKDGADGKDGKDAVADPTVDVIVNTNVFPVGQDGWAVQNKNIAYQVRSYNTQSAIRTTISADGSGHPYAYVHNWLDAFTLGKLGLDVWTLFQNPDDPESNPSNYQEFGIEHANSVQVTNDLASLLSSQCIDIPLSRFRENAFIKEYDRIYFRFAFISNEIPFKVSPMYSVRTQGGSTIYASAPRVDINEYSQNDYRSISVFGNWIDSTSSRSNWIDEDMYLRFYFENPVTDVNIKIFEYMAISLDEILPSGHSLAQYIANAQISDITGTMDLLPWFSGEYEVGVDLTWGTARRMFTDFIQVHVLGDLYIDTNYIAGLEFDGNRYSVGVDTIPGYNENTHILTTSVDTLMNIYYIVPEGTFNQCWDFSNSTGLYCNTSDLPYVTYGLNLTGCTGITGDTEYLPRVEKEIILSGCTGISGSVFNMPKVIKYMNIHNCDSIGYDKEGHQESATGLWWMEEDPDLDGSAVTGTYPYLRS